jgi:hypothetical protein
MPTTPAIAVVGLLVAIAAGASGCGGRQSTHGTTTPSARTALLTKINPICTRDDAAIRKSEGRLATGYSFATVGLIHKELVDVGAVLFKDKSDAKDNRFYAHVTNMLLHVGNAITVAKRAGAPAGTAPGELLAGEKAAHAAGIRCSFGAPS